MKRIALIVLIAMAVVGQSSSFVRVYLTDRDSWNNKLGTVHRSFTEQVKTLGKECPGLKVTADKDKADFVLVWDSKTWNETSWSDKMNNFVIYDRDGDVVTSGGADRMTNAARQICGTVIPKERIK